MMLDTKNEQMWPLLDWNRKKPSGKGHIYFAAGRAKARLFLFYAEKWKYTFLAPPQRVSEAQSQ